MVKNPPDNTGNGGDVGSMMPWSKKRHPTPVFLFGKFQGQRNLVGFSSWGHNESDTTEQLRTAALSEVLHFR